MNSMLTLMISLFVIGRLAGETVTRRDSLFGAADVSNNKTDASVIERNTARPPGRLVAIGLGVLLVFVVVQVWLNAKDRSDRIAWIANTRAKMAVDDAYVDRLREVRHAWIADRGAQPQIADAERLVNGGKPLVVDAKGEATVTDPATGASANLWIMEQTTWAGVVPHTIYPSRLHPPNHPAIEAMTTIRRLAYLGGYLMWLTGFVVFVIRWRNEPQADTVRAARRLVVIASVASVLALIGPEYWQTWYVFVDPGRDAPAFGGIAVVVSLLMLFLVTRQFNSADGPPECYQCGYDLTGNVSGVCPECGRRVIGGGITKR
jgi:predicted RNA-binding Zn-ribbon protein involved in translation (DUF1610 family)